MQRKLSLLAVAVLLASCGDDGPSSTSTDVASADVTSETETTTTGSLIPLEEAQAAQDAAKTVYGTVGGDAVKIDGLTFAVPAMGEPTDNDGTRILPVDVRVENPSSSEVQAPDVELHCADDDATHFFMTGSTYPPDDRQMPPGTFTEGTILMEYPEGCAEGYIEVVPLVSTDRTPIVRFLIDTSMPPPTAPSTTLVETEGEIDTPAEAAADLVAKGVTCDRYMDSETDPTYVGPPILDGTCENGDLELTLSVFEGDPQGTMNVLLQAYGELYKSFGAKELAVVFDGNVSYSAQPLDGSIEPVPSQATLDLLNQIADVTGGELKTYTL